MFDSNGTAGNIPQDWKPVGKTGAVTRRFEFPDYAATSAFLDALNVLSKEMSLYPDLGFARTYVNVTIPGDEDGGTATRDRFAARTNAIYEGAQT